MEDINPIIGILINVLILIIIIVAGGYFGQWYASNQDYASCKLGVGGECGMIGSCDEECDMEKVMLCWIPVKIETPSEQE